MPAGPTRAVELRDHLRILPRWGWVLALAVVVVVATGELLTARQVKIYEASSVILLEAPRGRVDVDTQIRVIEGASIRARVLEEVPTAGRVVVRRAGTGRLVRLTAQSRRPDLAARAADAYVGAYLEYLRERRLENLLVATDQTRRKIAELDDRVAQLTAELEDETALIDRRALPVAGESVTAARARQQAVARERRELETGTQARRDTLLGEQLGLESVLRDLQDRNDPVRPGAEVATPAAVPDAPLRDDHVSEVLRRIVLGLTLGSALAFLFEYLDGSLATTEDVERALGARAPVLATIPRILGWKDASAPELVSLTAPRSPPAEAFRSLRTSVQLAGIDRPVRAVAISSPSVAEGKTTVTANLAVAVAGAGRPVVVVDCDLRRPRLHKFFGMPNDVGLTSWMMGDVPLSVAVTDVAGIPRLSLLPCGPPPPNPSEMLSSRRFSELVTALQGDGAVVMVDTPPLLPVTDAAVVARAVDAVIVVTMAGRGTKGHLRHAMDVLEQVGASNVGVVLNRRDEGRVHRYRQGAYYYPVMPGPRVLGTARSAR